MGAPGLPGTPEQRSRGIAGSLTFCAVGRLSICWQSNFDLRHEMLFRGGQAYVAISTHLDPTAPDHFLLGDLRSAIAAAAAAGAEQTPGQTRDRRSHGEESDWRGGNGHRAA